MKKGSIYLYYGEGKGKTTLAVGQGMRVLGEENTAIMIQFLNFNEFKEFTVLKRLEPDFRVFKFGECSESINIDDTEVIMSLKEDIKSGIQLVNKIIETGECDLLILDGVLDAIKIGGINVSDLCDLLCKRDSYMDIIITGNSYIEEIGNMANYVYSITTQKDGKTKLMQDEKNI